MVWPESFLMLGSFTILLNGMSNISNGVLQGIGKPKIPMITAAVALVVDVIVVVAASDVYGPGYLCTAGCYDRVCNRCMRDE